MLVENGVLDLELPFAETLHVSNLYEIFLTRG